MLPTTISPVLMPMRISSAAPALRHAVSWRLTSSSISSAVSQARAAWSCCASGAFHSAMTASPTNLSSVPPLWATQAVMRSR